MIGWLTDDLKMPNKLNFCKLAKIMNIIEDLDDEYSKYVFALYQEYKNLFDKKFENIEDSIIKKIKIQKLNQNLPMANNCNIVLSNSHKETYFLIKELNKTKLKNSTVICFDMHSDTYSHEDNAWKGNVFSKLLYEKIIDNVLIIGVPQDKLELTLNDIDENIRDSVHIIKIQEIEKYIVKTQTKNIFLSIDVDCMNTRKLKMTSLEYCPATILNNISNFSEDVIYKKDAKNIIKNAIFVKNNLGYSNLYHVGENGLDLTDLKEGILQIKKCCDKLKLNLGFESKCYADITELFGYDYDDITLCNVIELIKILKEVK